MVQSLSENYRALMAETKTMSARMEAKRKQIAEQEARLEADRAQTRDTLANMDEHSRRIRRHLERNLNILQQMKKLHAENLAKMREILARLEELEALLLEERATEVSGGDPSARKKKASSQKMKPAAEKPKKTDSQPNPSTAKPAPEKKGSGLSGEVPPDQRTKAPALDQYRQEIEGMMGELEEIRRKRGQLYEKLRDLD